MMQASMIVSDWQPEIGRSPTPEQLRDIFQKELMDLGPALFLADKSGAIRWCNSGYRRVAEVQTEDGRIGDLLPLRQVAEEIEYSRATVYREDRYIIGQTTQILKSRMVPVFDNDGALNGFGGILQMFADHGIGTEDIALMLDRYMDFLRLTADWVWETDAQLNFTMVSQRVTNALDRPPQDYIGKNLLTMMVTDTLRQAAKRRFERMAPFRDVPFDADRRRGQAAAVHAVARFRCSTALTARSRAIAAPPPTSPSSPSARRACAWPRSRPTSPAAPRPISSPT